MAELCRELGDQAPPRASLARAYNLLARSGREPDGFLATPGGGEGHHPRPPGVASPSAPRAEGATGRRNMVPYCFAVLERLVDAEQHPEGPATTAAATATPAQATGRPGAATRGGWGKEATPASEAEALWRAVLDGMRERAHPWELRALPGRARGGLPGGRAADRPRHGDGAPLVRHPHPPPARRVARAVRPRRHADSSSWWIRRRQPDDRRSGKEKPLIHGAERAVAATAAQRQVGMERRRGGGPPPAYLPTTSASLPAPGGSIIPVSALATYSRGPMLIHCSRVTALL